MPQDKKDYLREHRYSLFDKLCDDISCRRRRHFTRDRRISSQHRRFYRPAQQRQNIKMTVQKVPVTEYRFDKKKYALNKTR